MFCPKCGKEYREGIKVCSDCGSALVEKPPEKPELRAMAPVWLTYEKSAPEADMLCGILRDKNIKFLRVVREDADFMKPYAGGALFGEDIYVDREDYSEAKETADFFAAPSPAPEDAGPEEGPESFPPKPQRAFRKVVAILCGIALLLWLLTRFIR